MFITVVEIPRERAVLWFCFLVSPQINEWRSSTVCGDKIVWQKDKEWRHLRSLMGRLKILEVAEQKKRFNRGMLSEFMLKSLFPILLLVLSVMLNKTANFFRSLFFGCILGHEYVALLRRDAKRCALRFEYLHSSYKKAQQETWSYSLPRLFPTPLSLMFFNPATHLSQSESQMHPQKC